MVESLILVGFLFALYKLVDEKKTNYLKRYILSFNLIYNRLVS